jgi:AcrR family transcriptional regulator
LDGFFPHKEAIIQALIERYMDTFENVFPQELDTGTPIEMVTRQVISAFVRFSRQNRGFQVVLVGLEGTSSAGIAAGMQAVIASGIERVLAAYYPNLEADKRHMCALVSFGLMAGIMPFDIPEEIMIEQMVLAVTSYQRAFIFGEVK